MTCSVVTNRGDELRESLDGVKDELLSQRELNLSLQAQRDYLKTEKIAAKKPAHNCAYANEIVEEKLSEERRRNKNKMRRKDQEIVALRATLARLHD